MRAEGPTNSTKQSWISGSKIKGGDPLFTKGGSFINQDSVNDSTLVTRIN